MVSEFSVAGSQEVRNRAGVTGLDTAIVLMVALMWTIMAATILSPIVQLFLTLSWVVFLTYLFAWLTGGFSGLSLSPKPFILIAFITGIVFWTVIGNLLPSSVDASSGFNSLQGLLGQHWTNYISNVIMFPLSERLFFGFVFTLLLGLGKTKDKEKLGGVQKRGAFSLSTSGGGSSLKFGIVVSIFLILTIVFALLHTQMALAFAKDGGFSFQTILNHQIVTQAIFNVIMLVGGVPAAIGAAIAKDLLAYFSPDYLLVTLVFLAALSAAGSKKPMSRIVPN